MTCPSSWETASPKWACAGVTLRQRETDWPSIRVHHRPPGTPGCLFEQSMIPVVCWSNQLHGSLCPSLPEKHRYIQLYFIKTKNTLHMLHAYSLCQCCLSTSVQSETQQSSLWWIWWSFQEHRLPPSTESDAIAGKTHNKYMEYNNSSHTHSLIYCCCSILKNMIPTIHWWTQETQNIYQTLFTLHCVSIQIVT